MFAVIKNDVQRNELAKFYKINLWRFLNMAFSNLHNKNGAEDAVQEAFSSIVKRPERFFAVPQKYRLKYMLIIIRNIKYPQGRIGGNLRRGNDRLGCYAGFQSLTAP